MQYQQAVDKMNDLRRQVSEIRAQLREIQSGIEPQEVENYEFADSSGRVRLSDLFGRHDSLIVIHNMGASCMYCTLWADGFNGVHKHLENRAGFVLSSPDTPGAQKTFADSRGWSFRMVSHAGTNFAAEMGYTGEHGFEPGVSVFRRDGDRILRVSDTWFGPGDDFCAVWHLFDLLPEGPDNWQPQYRYS